MHIGLPLVTLQLALLRAVDLHVLVGRQGLIGRLHQLGTAFLDTVADPAVALGHLAHHPGQRRGQHEDGQGHLPAVPEHHRQCPQCLQRLLHHHLGRIHGSLGHLVGIGAQPYQHRGHRLGIKALPGQAHVFVQHHDP